MSLYKYRRRDSNCVIYFVYFIDLHLMCFINFLILNRNFFNVVHFIMLGIQRMIGPNISEAKTELIKLIHQKDHLNGVVHDTLSSNSKSVQKMQLHTRLMKKVQEFYSLIISQINYYKGISSI